MRIMIIRHGDPDYGKDCLTEKGWREVNLLADRLEKEQLDHIYVSSYRRAKQTAQPTLERLGREEVIYDWLHEFDYPIIREDGTPKHIPWDLMPSKWTSYEENFSKDDWGNAPVMKSGNIREKYDAVIKELDAMLARHGYVRDGYTYRVERANTETIALFCHFGLECVLLSHLINISPVALWHGMVASPTAVTTLYTEEREKGIAYFRMNLFGDVSHLTNAGEPVSLQARFCEIYDDFAQKH